MASFAAPPDILSSTYVTNHALADLGLTRHAISTLVRSGQLMRLRKGRYVPCGSHPDLVRAGQLGARLDCVSLLRVLGVFVLESGGLHVQVEALSSRLPLPAPHERMVRHWRATSRQRGDLATDIVDALAQACRCQGARQAIATLDSAWHLGLVDEGGIGAVFARLPRRHRRLRGLLDARAESGPETLMRLMLRGIGCAFEVQVEIETVGRVDFVVDGWLIIECDSKDYHEGWAAQKRDRRRDMAAAALGYTTVRPLAEDIMYRPEVVLDDVRRAVQSRRQHNSFDLRRVAPGSPRNGRA